MFSDGIKISSIVYGFLGYLLFTNIVFAVVVNQWIPAGVTVPSEIAALAESDRYLINAQIVIGLVIGFLSGMIACWSSRSKGLKNPLILGVLLTLYGFVGIYLHPDHPIWYQTLKLLLPIPLVLLGAITLIKMAGNGRKVFVSD